ncbi:hypothetical protein RFI_03212 [Reticulomyxa filosa]|uniref:Uncharacterized protein n=1 Tax=Reticulomyxa filosa TaxID=46433 RepID=X6P714_RETFI|nr:hypothetical protein RFI_03212 [Reticulomyxa filosa]|eukprot:ETO33883.1 hypothetical protein RFI_03212 [Reticulomyxa filosa]
MTSGHAQMKNENCAINLRITTLFIKQKKNYNNTLYNNTCSSKSSKSIQLQQCKILLATKKNDCYHFIFNFLFAKKRKKFIINCYFLKQFLSLLLNKYILTKKSKIQIDYFYNFLKNTKNAKKYVVIVFI